MLELVVLPGMLPVVPEFVPDGVLVLPDVDGIVEDDDEGDVIVLSARESGFATLLGGTGCGTVCEVLGVEPVLP